MKHESSSQRLRVQIRQNRNASRNATAVSSKSPRKRHYGRFLIAASALTPIALLAQSLAPTPPNAGQVELSKVEEWVLSQGTEESIAPELAAIFGIGSDRLPVKVKSFRASKGIDDAFAVTTNSAETAIVLSALKTLANTRQIYFVGNAWLTDRSGNLRRTIYIDASGARIVSNSSHAAEFKDIKDFFLKKLKATSPNTTSSPSPGVSARPGPKRK